MWTERCGKDLFEMHSQCFDNIWSRRMEYLRSVFLWSIPTFVHPLRWGSTRSPGPDGSPGHNVSSVLWFPDEFHSHVNIMNHSQQGRPGALWFVTVFRTPWQFITLKKSNVQHTQTSRHIIALSFNLNFTASPPPSVSPLPIKML